MNGDNLSKIGICRFRFRHGNSRQ